MNALSIVMISVASVLVVLITMVIIALVVLKKVTTAKKEDYEFLNKYAPRNPIVFLGDSLTDFYPVQEFFHDDKIVNRGIANETTDDIMARLDDILVLSPRAVFLQAGINNFIHSFKSVSPQIVADKVMAIVNKLQETAGEVFLISLYPLNNKKRNFSKIYLRTATNKAVLETNALLKQRCKERGITFIDIHSELLDSTGRLEKTYTVEGLHLTYKGYEVVTKCLQKYVDGITVE